MGRVAVSLVVVATLALAGRAAHAQPAAYSSDAERPPFAERFSAGLGVHIANSDSAWLHIALMGEAAMRAPGVPAPFMIRGRGFFSIAGGTEQSDWSGKYYLVGGGIEVLACTGGQGFCGVAGVDAGYEVADLTDDNSGQYQGGRTGLVLGPRLGLEAGTNLVRFRFLIDRYRWKTDSRWMANGGVTFGVAVRF